jgi:hypothetical protein
MRLAKRSSGVGRRTPVEGHANSVGAKPADHRPVARTVHVDARTVRAADSAHERTIVAGTSLQSVPLRTPRSSRSIDVAPPGSRHDRPSALLLAAHNQHVDCDIFAAIAPRLVLCGVTTQSRCPAMSAAVGPQLARGVAMCHSGCACADTRALLPH